MPIWKKAPAVKPMAERFPNPKPTQQYEKPIGPEQPAKVTGKEKFKQAIKKAGDYVAPKIKNAGMRVAQNAERSAGRDSGMINIRPPEDMYSFKAPSYMMGMPGQEPAPRAAPRRKKPKNKKTKRAAPRKQGGQNWQQLGGVPPEVKRWMM